MTDRKIERSDGRGFGRQQLLANSIENFISHENKKWLVGGVVAVRNLQSIKTISTVKLSQYRNSGSTFYSSEPALVAVRSDCWRLGNALCSRSPVRPAQAEQESCPKSLAVDIAL